MLDILISSLDVAVDGEIDSGSFGPFVADGGFSCQCANTFDVWDRWYRRIN